MSETRPQGRLLPNARCRRVMLAIQDVMGQSGLVTVLRQAGLQRWASELPAPNAEPGLRAGEYAALVQAIENYYGRGARGTLTRIGHACFQRLLAEQPRWVMFYRLLRPVLPVPLRRQLVLRRLARELAQPDGHLHVKRDGGHVVLEDYTSDLTCGRQRDTEICWLTLGEVQEALTWGTGREHDVAEIACRAKGDPACRFRVGDELA